MAKGDPITVPDLPWKCPETGLDKPECHCPRCAAEARELREKPA